ncbi:MULTISPECIES: hypothetical protein [unclassified Luteibacter]|uniref:hypothetical protein n=1 Tax=Luteibacter sp. PvP019 TaxID=3156436 RepID=UPI0033931648
MKKRYLPLALVALLAGCSGRSADYAIDNPTDKPLSLTIDGKTYEVAPHEDKELSLDAGEHTMKGDVVGDIKFISYYRGRGGIINPTLSDYVIYRQSFEKVGSTSPGYTGKLDQVVLEGVTFEGTMRQSSDLFIDKDWTYGVDEELPDSVVEHENGSNNTVHNKVFRAKDFIVAFLGKNPDAKKDFEANRQKDAPPVVRKVTILPSTLPPIDNAEVQQLSLPLRENYAKYLKAKDVSEQEALQKENFKLSMAYSHASVEIMQKGSLSKEVNEQMNAFQEAMNRAYGSTALVEP